MSTALQRLYFLFTGTGFATCSIKENAADSDADLDVDGDDTLEYGKAQYTEADVIPCSGAGEDQGEAREREALRGAVLKYERPNPLNVVCNFPNVTLLCTH